MVIVGPHQYIYMHACFVGIFLCIFLSSCLLFWDKQYGVISILDEIVILWIISSSRLCTLMLLSSSRGIPKLCWKAANALRRKHICCGTLMEDRCQPTPALQATGDQQPAALHQSSPHRQQALQTQQKVPSTAQNHPAEAEVRCKIETGGIFNRQAGKSMCTMVAFTQSSILWLIESFRIRLLILSYPSLFIGSCRKD